MNELQKHILKSLVYGYSQIVVKEAKDKKEEAWYQHAYRVNKYFSQKKQLKLTRLEQNKMMLAKREMVDFDIEYFEDKDYSPYLCMIVLLEYLILELEDLETRNRFSSIPFEQIRKEVFNMDGLNVVSRYVDRYATAVIEKVRSLV